MIEVVVGFWKNKIADVYHIGYVTFMNYISVFPPLMRKEGLSKI